MADADRVAATLAGIRGRYACTRAPITGNSVTTLFASASDVPRLLAAAEAALKLADEAREIDSDVLRTPCWDLDPDELREAIGAALTGTQLSEDENHG